MKKYLVIHPKDSTTDFLEVIYSDFPEEETTILRDLDYWSKSALGKEIREHETILMLGHGDQYGLFSPNKRIINMDLIYALKDKDVIAVWCNADKFIKKYKLFGIYTGMIISELEEAEYYNINTSLEELTESNNLFALAMKNFIVSSDIEQFKTLYNIESELFNFNKQRVYENSSNRKP